MKKLFFLALGLMLFSTCKKEKQLTGTPADFLSSSVYDKMVVEVVYVEGMRPTQLTLYNLKAFLQKYLHKPAGIEISEKGITSPGKAIYTFDDIQALESANRTMVNTTTRITAYMFFVDGEYDKNTQNSKILGIAYGTSSIAIFEKTIKDFSGGLMQPSETTVETTVASHELGHILGLVNNGIKPVSGHQDEPHGKHCDNSKCLMYYATETSDVISNLLSNQVPSLDDNCMDDLKSAGGK